MSKVDDALATLSALVDEVVPLLNDAAAKTAAAEQAAAASQAAYDALVAGDSAEDAQIAADQASADDTSASDAVKAVADKLAAVLHPVPVEPPAEPTA